MAGAVAVQVAREDVFESCHLRDDSTTPSQDPTSSQHPSNLESRVEVRSPSADEAGAGLNTAGNVTDDRPVALEAPVGDDSQAFGDGEGASGITVARYSRLAPYKPGKMTVVLDMDECLLHSKFHGPGAASEAYRQLEHRPDAVTEVNSFWVALEDGDTAQVRKKERRYLFLIPILLKCFPFHRAFSPRPVNCTTLVVLESKSNSLCYDITWYPSKTRRLLLHEQFFHIDHSAGLSTRSKNSGCIYVTEALQPSHGSGPSGTSSTVTTVTAPVDKFFSLNAINNVSHKKIYKKSLRLKALVILYHSVYQMLRSNGDFSTCVRFR